MKQQEMMFFLAASALIGAENNLMYAGCGECDTDFEFEASTTGLNKDLTIQVGGAGVLFILHNSAPFTDVTDQAEWEARLNPTLPDLPKMIAFNGCYNTGGYGQEAQTETLGSCQKTANLFENNTFTFEVIEDNATYDVWKQMVNLQDKRLQNCFQFAYKGCNGTVVGFIPATIGVLQTIDNVDTGKVRWVITFTWKSTQNALPLVLAFDPVLLIP